MLVSEPEKPYVRFKSVTKMSLLPFTYFMHQSQKTGHGDQFVDA